MRAYASATVRVRACVQIINMATFVAGFGSLGIGVDMLDIYEKYGMEEKQAWQIWIGRICVYLSSVTLFLSLWVVCVVLSVVPHARRWALDGPVESVEDAVRKLNDKLSQVINVFMAALITFIIERVGNCALFDTTSILAPAMLATGGLTLVLIAREHRAALSMYSVGTGAEAKYKHRSFPERPPEVYRELGRMKRITNVLGTRACGPSIFASGAMHSPLQSPQKGGFGTVRHGAACGRRMVDLGSLPASFAPLDVGADRSAAAEGVSHHSWLDVTRVVGGKARGYARRYGSIEGGIVTLYGTYEDYILDVPSQSLSFALSDYKLAELGEHDGAECVGLFELVPILARPHEQASGWGRSAGTYTYRFRPESLKAAGKWIAALRAALLAAELPNRSYRTAAGSVASGRDDESTASGRGVGGSQSRQRWSAALADRCPPSDTRASSSHSQQFCSDLV